VFVRFRETQSRLQASLIETRRVECKVRHEHIASLGSISLSLSVADRIGFWARLHERLGKLGNRLDPERQAKIMGDVHARVPMPTLDEQRALQLENAKTEVAQQEAVRDFVASDVTGRERLIEYQQAVVAAGKAAVSEGDEAVNRARTRVEAIERGDAVEGGLSKPQTIRAFLKALGWTDADQQHANLLALIPEEHFDELVKLSLEPDASRRRRVRKAVLTLLRKFDHGS